MAEITILAFAKFREVFGEKTVLSVNEGTNILSCLKMFAEQKHARDELFDGHDIKSHVILMYNRERIDLEEADKIKVRDGDEIVLYPPVSGG